MRHGESEGNIDPSVYSRIHNDKIKLTKRGKKQARQAANKILKEDINGPSEIISSTYTRALDTSKEIAKTLKKSPQKICQNLLTIERNWGVFVGQDVDNPTSVLENFLQDNDLLHYKPPRGESLFEVYVRAGLFVMEQAQFLKYSAIIVSHRDFLVMLHAYLTKEIPTLDRHWDNCEIRKYSVNEHFRERFTYLGAI